MAKSKLRAVRSAIKRRYRVLKRRLMRSLNGIRHGIRTDSTRGGTNRDQRSDLPAARNRKRLLRQYGKNALLVRKKRKSPFLLAVLFSTLKILVFCILLSGVAAFGIGIGVIKAYVETTLEMDIAQLTISDRTSFLYDRNGKLITSIADVEYRDWADIEEIPDMLKNAFISIEDVRFYKHSGVDFKRLFSAVLEVLGNSNSSGGSTITQQLIKNKILGTERTYKRKIQEAYLAIKLEKMISKDRILEAYLNDIHLGDSNYGVKVAAKDYFGKELNELTIRECAMLAGLTQNPYNYNPRRNMYQRDKMEVTDARTNTVLSRMYQAGYINSEQYRQALEEKVRILEVSEQKQMYSMAYFVEYAMRDVVTHLLRQRDLPDTPANRNMVENELRTSGYHIYTTVDPDIQNTVQSALTDWKNYPTLADSSKSVLLETNSDDTIIETIEPQAAAVVLDQHTGNLLAVVGGREEPIIRKGMNRAFQSYTEVGSAIKPLAVYGPALDLGFPPSTVIANMDGRIDGWDTEKGYPSGGLDHHYGPVTMRRGLMSSLNVVAGRILYDHVGTTVSKAYLLALGATESKINADGPGLALGTSGFTPIQMSAAYGAIANAGIYNEPLSFTMVIDSEGNVVLDADRVRETRRVFSVSTSFLLVDMMEDAVRSGTGTKAKISNMTVAGKTGTNSDYASVYFAGMTPYYTSVIWIGHDYPTNKLTKGASGGDYAAPLWQAYMSKISEGLSDKSILEIDPVSIGLTKHTVCTVSGKLATDACKADEDHKPRSDYFLPDNAPTEYCDMHVQYDICSVSGAVATQYCPAEHVHTQTCVLIRDGSQFAGFDDLYLYKGIANAVRTEWDMTVSEYESRLPLCTLHAGGATSVFEIRGTAEDLILEVQNYLYSGNLLSDDQRNLLAVDISELTAALSSYDYSTIEARYAELQSDFIRIRGY